MGIPVRNYSDQSVLDLPNKEGGKPETIPEQAGNNKDNENWIKNKVISLEKLLKENECINLDKELVQKFFNGVKLKYNGLDGIYKIYFNNEFLGTGVVKEKSLKRDIIVISEKY